VKLSKNFHVSIRDHLIIQLPKKTNMFGLSPDPPL
jgi:hypothetical protein